jgi:hypothetical protein
MLQEVMGLVVLKDSCVGCRRFTWLCRQDRRCKKYNIKPKGEYALGVLTRAGLELDIKESGATSANTQRSAKN